MIPLGTLSWLLALRGPAILDRDTVLIAGWIALSAMLLVVAILLHTTPANAVRLTPGHSTLVVVGVGALLQAAALVLLLPALSEDVLRYRMDGRTWLIGASPYANSPRELFQTFPADSIDRAVPFADLHTFYPSTAQAAFVAAAAIERTFGSPPQRPGTWRQMLPGLPPLHRAMVLRVMASLASVIALVVLIRMLRDSGRSVWWAALFAWHPLVIVETAGMGHVDALGVLLVLMSLRAQQTNRFALAGAMLALAVGVKPVAILLLPFVARSSPKRVLGSFLLCATAVLLPMAIDHGWVESARLFSRHWEANGSLYELFKHVFGSRSDYAMQRSKDLARMIGPLLILLAMMVLWWKRVGAADAGYWLMLLVLLVSPVVYPWYLLWMLCFVPLTRAPGWTGLVFAATVCVNYMLWHQAVWVLPGRLLMAEYLPVYAALGYEAMARLSSRADRAT
jgi:hypothetical protein